MIYNSFISLACSPEELNLVSSAAPWLPLDFGRSAWTRGAASVGSCWWLATLEPLPSFATALEPLLQLLSGSSTLDPLEPISSMALDPLELGSSNAMVFLQPGSSNPKAFECLLFRSSGAIILELLDGVGSSAGLEPLRAVTSVALARGLLPDGSISPCSLWYKHYESWFDEKGIVFNILKPKF